MQICCDSLTLSLLIKSCFGANYTYHFYNNPTGSNTANSNGASPSNPYFRSPCSDSSLRRELSPTVNNPIWTRRGVMLIEGSALCTLYTQSMPTPAAYTVILWAYVYNDQQVSCLFGKVDDTTKISKICFMLDSGFMKVRCEGCSRLRDLTTIDRYSGIDSQIGVGWNMISYTDTGSGFKFRTSKYFQTFTSNSALYFTYTDGNIGILGGYRSGGTIVNSFQGIIHSLWVIDQDLSDSSLQTNYVPPSSTCIIMCDYYIAMFKDLTTLTGQYFTNDYSLIDPTFSIKGDKITLPPDSNGVNLNSGGKIEVKDILGGDTLSISLQFWFKGVIPSDPSGYFVNLESSGKQPVYLQRSGNNLNIGSTLTSSSYTLSGVFKINFQIKLEIIF